MDDSRSGLCTGTLVQRSKKVIATIPVGLPPITWKGTPMSIFKPGSQMTGRSASKSIVLAAVLGLALTACGGSGTTASSTTTSTTAAPEANVVHVKTVDLTDSQAIESDVTTFKVGVPYHFVVENTGFRKHELMIVQPIEAGTMDMEHMDEMALHVVEEDDLEPGATVEFDFTFPADAAGTSLEFACHIPDHYEAGMHLPITVEA